MIFTVFALLLYKRSRDNFYYFWRICAIPKVYDFHSFCSTALLKVHNFYNFWLFCYTEGPRFSEFVLYRRLKVLRCQPNIPVLFRGECPPGASKCLCFSVYCPVFLKISTQGIGTPGIVGDPSKAGHYTLCC